MGDLFKWLQHDKLGLVVEIGKPTAKHPHGTTTARFTGNTLLYILDNEWVEWSLKKGTMWRVKNESR